MFTLAIIGNGSEVWEVCVCMCVRVCVCLCLYLTSKPQEKCNQNIMESFNKVVSTFLSCNCSLLVMVCFPNINPLFLYVITYCEFTLPQRDSLSHLPSYCKSVYLAVDVLSHRSLPCCSQMNMQPIKNDWLPFGNYADTEMLN